MGLNAVRILMVLLGINTALLSTGQNADIQTFEEQLDSLFAAVMEEQRIPGAGLIIVKDGKTLLKKGYGFTTLGEDIAYVNPDSTVFRIGSITKSFTALALLQQIANGKIEIDNSIDLFLPDIPIPPTSAKAITPFHLLTHSAGFDELGNRRVFEGAQQIPLSTFLKTNLKSIRNK